MGRVGIRGVRRTGPGALVQILALVAVVMTCWFTLDSGGPFGSPYGQVLLALPLMSPIVAYRPVSIVMV